MPAWVPSKSGLTEVDNLTVVTHSSTHLRRTSNKTKFRQNAANLPPGVLHCCQLIIKLLGVKEGGKAAKADS